METLSDGDARSPALTGDAADAGDGVLARIDALLDEVAQVQAAIGSLEARRAVLLAQVVQEAVEAEEAVLNPDDPELRRTSSARRRELARRAVVAEVATTLQVGDYAAGSWCDHAQTLRDKAPRSLAELAAGRCSWTHATKVARHLADLEPQDAWCVDASIAPVLADCTPGQADVRTRRAREGVHPEPLEVRHRRAASQRAVYLDDGRDGMAWLSAHLPAPVAHAAYDRLCRTVSALRGTGDARTAGQGRADAMAALLLDDGTLDRAAVPAPLRPAAGEVVIGHAAPAAPSDGAGPFDGAGSSARPGPLGSESYGSRGALATAPVAGDPFVLPGQGPPDLAVIARAIRPRVTVTVPVLTLLGGAEIPADLEGYGPVDANTARELVALAPSLRRVLTHPETGAVLSVGRDAYTVPASLKAALVRRDATCRFPGCTVPARRSDLDHTRAWSDGGTTSAGNLAHLCRRHHVLKHQSAWSVRPAPPDARGGGSADLPRYGGALEWISPTGRRHVTSPDGSLPASLHRSLPESPLPPGHESVGDLAGVPPDDEGPPPPF